MTFEYYEVLIQTEKEGHKQRRARRIHIQSHTLFYPKRNLQGVKTKIEKTRQSQLQP